MENQIPKTKKECFDILDKMTSEEDKKHMLEAESSIDFHFSLGMWIRNNWLYPMADSDYMAFSKNFAEGKRFQFYFDHNIPISPDEISSIIIDKYIKHLKNLVSTDKNNSINS